MDGRAKLMVWTASKSEVGGAGAHPGRIPGGEEVALDGLQAGERNEVPSLGVRGDVGGEEENSAGDAEEPGGALPWPASTRLRMSAVTECAAVATPVSFPIAWCALRSSTEVIWHAFILTAAGDPGSGCTSKMAKFEVYILTIMDGAADPFMT
ncbi:hypothetical protein ZWY2020_047240 [Hordeum vulgare]|nr:hypothetical protein ZWY2020_047240 [Hordeum vulgare]